MSADGVPNPVTILSHYSGHDSIHLEAILRYLRGRAVYIASRSDYRDSSNLTADLWRLLEATLLLTGGVE